MDNSWQMFLTLLCVAGAAVQLGFRIWRHLHNSHPASSCGGGCNGCPAAAKPESPQLIQLEVKSRP